MPKRPITTRNIAQIGTKSGVKVCSESLPRENRGDEKQMVLEFTAALPQKICAEFSVSKNWPPENDPCDGVLIDSRGVEIGVQLVEVRNKERQRHLAGELPSASDRSIDTTELAQEITVLVKKKMNLTTDTEQFWLVIHSYDYPLSLLQNLSQEARELLSQNEHHYDRVWIMYSPYGGDAELAELWPQFSPVGPAVDLRGAKQVLSHGEDFANPIIWKRIARDS